MWLLDVYSLAAQGKIDDAIDVVFERFDVLFSAGEFARADSLLLAIDLKKLDLNLMLSVLTITLAAKEELPNRSLVAARIAERVNAEHPERASRLLAGLL